MEPDPNLPKTTKSQECPVTNQINRYRNSLPEVDRSQNHFFFKEVHHSEFDIAYVTIGYRVGQVPFELMDLFAVIINEIHTHADCNLKIILDGDQLWVTSTTGFSLEFIDSLSYNVEESNLNESLLKTQNLLSQFLEKRKKQNRKEDKIILQEVQKQLCKSIMLVFKNPNLDD